MQDFLIALLIGFILGWVLEWLIDWQYWRPTVRALREENEQLRRQLQDRQAPGQAEVTAAAAQGQAQPASNSTPSESSQPTAKDA